jgi:hypothetical protein
LRLLEPLEQDDRVGNCARINDGTGPTKLLQRLRWYR